MSTTLDVPCAVKQPRVCFFLCVLRCFQFLGKLLGISRFRGPFMHAGKKR